MSYGLGHSDVFCITHQRPPFCILSPVRSRHAVTQFLTTSCPMMTGGLCEAVWRLDNVGHTVHKVWS